MVGVFAYAAHATARNPTRTSNGRPPDAEAASVGQATREAAMRCGLCPQAALTAWWLADWQLERWLCAHHSRDRGDAMLDAGWVLMADDRETVSA